MAARKRSSRHISDSSPVPSASKRRSKPDHSPVPVSNFYSYNRTAEYPTPQFKSSRTYDSPSQKSVKTKRSNHKILNASAKPLFQLEKTDLSGINSLLQATLKNIESSSDKLFKAGDMNLTDRQTQLVVQFTSGASQESFASAELMLMLTFASKGIFFRERQRKIVDNADDTGPRTLSKTYSCQRCKCTIAIIQGKSRGLVFLQSCELGHECSKSTLQRLMLLSKTKTTRKVQAEVPEAYPISTDVINDLKIYVAERISMLTHRQLDEHPQKANINHVMAATKTTLEMYGIKSMFNLVDSPGFNHELDLSDSCSIDLLDEFIVKDICKRSGTLRNFYKLADIQDNNIRDGTSAAHEIHNVRPDDLQDQVYQKLKPDSAGADVFIFNLSDPLSYLHVDFERPAVYRILCIPIIDDSEFGVMMITRDTGAPNLPVIISVALTRTPHITENTTMTDTSEILFNLLSMFKTSLPKKHGSVMKFVANFAALPGSASVSDVIELVFPKEDHSYTAEAIDFPLVLSNVESSIKGNCSGISMPSAVAYILSLSQELSEEAVLKYSCPMDIEKLNYIPKINSSGQILLNREFILASLFDAQEINQSHDGQNAIDTTSNINRAFRMSITKEIRKGKICMSIYTILKDLKIRFMHHVYGQSSHESDLTFYHDEFSALFNPPSSLFETCTVEIDSTTGEYACLSCKSKLKYADQLLVIQCNCIHELSLKIILELGQSYQQNLRDIITNLLTKSTDAETPLAYEGSKQDDIADTADDTGTSTETSHRPSIVQLMNSRYGLQRQNSQSSTAGLINGQELLLNHATHLTFNRAFLRNLVYFAPPEPSASADKPPVNAGTATDGNVMSAKVSKKQSSSKKASKAKAKAPVVMDLSKATEKYSDLLCINTISKKPDGLVMKKIDKTIRQLRDSIISTAEILAKPAATAPNPDVSTPISTAAS